MAPWFRHKLRYWSAGLVLAPALNKRRVNEMFEINKRPSGYSRNYGT
jgi:hypothetical protein